MTQLREVNPVTTERPVYVGSLKEIIFDDPPDIPTRNVMDFTLVYWDTTLKAASVGSKRNWEKHQIRRNLSEQLENLWKVSPSLRSFDQRGEIQDAHAKNYERGGIEFVPLVVEKWGLLCNLDITFLRPGVPGQIVSDSGDIDNRLKTLLDALRVPKDMNEMSLSPGESNPKRIYCLLEDDKLITGIRVTTDRLLVPNTAKDSEACVSIHVSIRGASILSPWDFQW